MKAQQIIMDHPSASGVFEFKDPLYGINFKAPIFNNRPIKKNSVFCTRDVYNIDKQDDGTAFRIFHSQLLRMCQDNRIINLGKLGLFVYLFILGELFDAYLNREISHKTRIIMTMHAYFFLNFWKSYIEETSEKTSKEWYSIA
ncbi:hypothetical protein GLOIN_2v1777971 [Rhizophagus irregularis DAOM 181602=DAOM 197198]|nr:hypothetical protein GLOIN_2v1777971 [Rhizophagus irregularis DAOM 181602=DAOM 197198]